MPRHIADEFCSSQCWSDTQHTFCTSQIRSSLLSSSYGFCAWLEKCFK